MTTVEMLKGFRAGTVSVNDVCTVSNADPRSYGFRVGNATSEYGVRSTVKEFATLDAARAYALDRAASSRRAIKIERMWYPGGKVPFGTEQVVWTRIVTASIEEVR